MACAMTPQRRGSTRAQEAAAHGSSLEAGHGNGVSQEVPPQCIWDLSGITCSDGTRRPGEARRWSAQAACRWACNMGMANGRGRPLGRTGGVGWDHFRGENGDSNPCLPPWLTSVGNGEDDIFVKGLGPMQPHFIAHLLDHVQRNLERGANHLAEPLKGWEGGSSTGIVPATTMVSARHCWWDFLE